MVANFTLCKHWEQYIKYENDTKGKIHGSHVAKLKYVEKILFSKCVINDGLPKRSLFVYFRKYLNFLINLWKRHLE
jgi:hypothetical protein